MFLISNVSYGAVITFDPATKAGSAGALLYDWTESGYLLEGSSFFLHTDSNVSSSVYPDNGTAYIRTTYNKPQLTLSNINGQLFDLLSVDIAEFSIPTAQYRKPISIVGHKADGSAVSTTMLADGIIDGHGPLADFETILFSEFTNLISVELPSQYGYSIDNIVVESVPEPTTLFLFAAGLAGLYTQRRVIRKNTIAA